MATRIRLMRIGKMREPHYRIVVADSRTKRDGRAIELVGEYHPKDDPSTIKVDSDRVQHWLRIGAQPSETVAAILRVTGDWQRFKGLPAPEPMKTAAPRPDRRAAFEEAAREGLGESSGSGQAGTPRKRPAKAAPRGAAAKPDEAPEAAAAAPEASAPAAEASAPASEA
ncbi:MAG TPA: 30S ribosomal protein S16 [Mycobacteriales bacterium]|nr:30S ribosomal protein S16 [Mycobacteriales bacterium]